MILIDTNVVLALMNHNDPLYTVAAASTPAMRREGIVLVWPVFAELTHFFRRGDVYGKFEKLCTILNLRMEPSEHLIEQLDVLHWLKQYATHRPDYADVHLVLLTAKLKHAKIWTFDSEFRTIWRRPDGSPVPLAIKD